MIKGIFLLAVFSVNICCFVSQMDETGRIPAEVSAPTPTPATDNKNDWKAAKYKGLIIGKSTRKELQQILGKPTSSGKSDLVDLPGNAVPSMYDEYTFKENFTGKLVVLSSPESPHTIESITIYPDNLDFKKFQDIFGNDFLVMRYSFVGCPGDSGSSQTREDPKGELVYYEYRDKGIVVDLDSDGNKVASVEFVSEAIHNLNHPC